jgi:hypothetical protein
VSLGEGKALFSAIFTHPARASRVEEHGKLSSVDVCVRAGLDGEKTRENLWLKGKERK